MPFLCGAPGRRRFNTSPRKTTMLRKMIESKGLEFIMEAHNGLSAKIVEETGFKGIWGSGLSISAAMGVRDSNEAAYTQVRRGADRFHYPSVSDGVAYRSSRFSSSCRKLPTYPVRSHVS